MSKTIEYPITANYISNWTVINALRELVANAIDQGNYSLEHNPRTNELKITNKDTCLELESLLLGNSNKNSSQIGQYGEGLKLSLLVLCRENKEVKIFNGKYQNWAPIIARSDLFKADVLKIKTRDVSGNRDNDFVITISNIERETYLDLHALFLQLNPVNDKYLVKTSHGELITDPEMVGSIYVKGVLVKKYKELDAAYNLSQADIGRDRQLLSFWDFQYTIKRIWLEAMKVDREKFKGKVYDLIEKGSRELDSLDDLDEKAQDILVDEYISRHDEDTIACVSEKESKELNNLGLKTTVVKPTLANILYKHLPSPEKLKKDKNLQIVKTINGYIPYIEHIIVVFKPYIIVEFVQFRDPITITMLDDTGVFYVKEDYQYKKGALVQLLLNQLSVEKQVEVLEDLCK